MATEAYTPEEAAARLRCKPSWLRTKAEKREIPFSMIAGQYRFTDDHIAWILDHFEETPRAPAQLVPAPAAKSSSKPRTRRSGAGSLSARPAPRLRAGSPLT